MQYSGIVRLIILLSNNVMAVVCSSSSRHLWGRGRVSHEREQECDGGDAHTHLFVRRIFIIEQGVPGVAWHTGERLPDCKRCVDNVLFP